MNELRENPRVWTALGLVLILYVFCALSVGPISNFGIQDGGVYFSSAKALATGQGYILPNFPVRVQARKYPELYPLLLAGIWKADPHFPGNILPAVGLTLAFGCLALVFAFLLLRQWPGLDDWQALGIVTLCALTEHFLILSASVMSDLPFMATMLGAIWLAGRAGRSSWATFGAGLLAGLSVGFRGLGLATIAGIGMVLLVKRDYRRAVWFSLAAGPVALVALWPGLSALLHSSGAHLTADPNASGWTQTLCYYSSYACNWRMNIHGAGTLKAVVLTNLKETVQRPGIYLLSPLAVRGGLWSLVVVMIVSAGAYVGMVRYVTKSGWQPLPIVFLFYLLLVLPWPYTPERFLLPFLPLFFGGLWLEGRHLATLVREHLGPRHTMAERTIGGLLAIGSLTLAAIVVVNYAWAVPSAVARQASQNRDVLTAERTAYGWIREHAAPDSRFVAYRAGLGYLYTGRSFVPPIICQTGAFYLGDRHVAQQDARHLADVVLHIHASYWLVSREDFLLTGNIDHAVLQKRQEQLLAGAPMVFRSADGMVRLYDVRCLWAGHTGGCSPKTEAGGFARSETASRSPGARPYGK